MFLSIVIFGLIGVMIGATALVAQPFSSGFLTPTVDNINGYAAGSAELSYSGQYNIPGVGQTWQGGIRVGNVRFVSDTDLGVEQVGFNAMMVHQLQFAFSIEMHTLTPWSSRIPGVTTGTGYAYQYQHLIWTGAQIQRNGFSYPMLNLPSNAYSLADQILSADVGVSVQLDPSLIGQGIKDVIPDSDGSGNFTLTNYYCAVLNVNADPTVATSSGLLKEPGTTFSDANVSQPPGSGLSWGGVDTTASVASKDATSRITSVLDAVGPAGAEFTVTPLTYEAHSAGAVETSMGLGDPATLTAGKPVNYEMTLLNDSSRCNLVAHLPFNLRPVTTIYQTKYTYNRYTVHDGIGLFDPPPYVQDYALGQFVTAYSGIQIQDVFAIQPMIVNVLVAYNYTWNPLTPGGDYPPIAPLLVNGTNNGWNVSPTAGVRTVGGNSGGSIFDGLFGPFGWIIWIGIIAVVAIVVWWVYTRLFRHKKR